MTVAINVTGCKFNEDRGKYSNSETYGGGLIGLRKKWALSSEEKRK